MELCPRIIWALCAPLYTLAETPHPPPTPPPPRILGSYTRALLVGQDRRHLSLCDLLPKANLGSGRRFIYLSTQRKFTQIHLPGKPLCPHGEPGLGQLQRGTLGSQRSSQLFNIAALVLQFLKRTSGSRFLSFFLGWSWDFGSTPTPFLQCHSPLCKMSGTLR